MWRESRSPLFGSHANECLRILCEIPVRQFRGTDKEQPLDPDGNLDSSFLAKIPADQSSRFRRSTATAWCSTWLKSGIKFGQARCATIAAAAARILVMALANDPAGVIGDEPGGLQIIVEA